MKNKLNGLLLFLSATLMLIAACSKQRVEMNSYSLPEQFMYDNRPQEQEFILNGDSGGPIIGNQNTHLWMDSSIFMYTNGNDVSYPITIKLIEVYTPKDMELYAMPTIAQGNLLVTAGEIRVRAFKDNEELVLKPGRVYPAQTPAQNPVSQMSIFYGKQVGDITDWEDNASAVSSNPGIDALEVIVPDTAMFYNLFVPVMGWINCDYFYNSSDPLTTITFESTDDDLTNVMKFLYFPGIQSVMQVYGNTSGNVPVGSTVKVLCFALNSSGNMCHFYQEINVTANQTVNVTLTEIAETDLIALMAGL
jgi:hypothetical protein